MSNGVQVDPGVGYRLIDKDVDKPQEGDEFFSIRWDANTWFPHIFSPHWLDGYEYRRKIDAGDGYRLIDPAVDKPESGDEVLHPVTGQFVPRCEWKGKEFGGGFTYRRKVVPAIDPGEGYRLIDPTTDKPQKGDEFWWPSGGKWSPRPCPGCVFHPDDIYRRKVEQTPKITVTFDGTRQFDIFGPVYISNQPACFTPPVTPAAPAIDPGEGYRLIDQLVDVPQDGDEFWNIYQKQWCKRACTNGKWLADNTYRRKIQTVHVYAQATQEAWDSMEDPDDDVDTVGPVRKLHEIGKIEGGTVFILYDNE